MSSQFRVVIAVADDVVRAVMCQSLARLLRGLPRIPRLAIALTAQEATYPIHQRHLDGTFSLVWRNEEQLNDQMHLKVPSQQVQHGRVRGSCTCTSVPFPVYD